MVHKRTHRGEKPYECDILCHKTFSDQSYIKQHKRSHSGEKPFECEVCHKLFGNPSVLRRHRRVLRVKNCTSVLFVKSLLAIGLRGVVTREYIQVRNRTNVMSVKNVLHNRPP